MPSIQTAAINSPQINPSQVNSSQTDPPQANPGQKKHRFSLIIGIIILLIGLIGIAYLVVGAVNKAIFRSDQTPDYVVSASSGAASLECPMTVLNLYADDYYSHITSYGSMFGWFDSGQAGSLEPGTVAQILDYAQNHPLDSEAVYVYTITAADGTRYEVAENPPLFALLEEFDINFDCITY